jgi:endogenous inhibitor of DNA gyrase (YacG/DUF329 family)
MEERDFFDERTEKKVATLNCPHCHQPAEYDVTWVVRTKTRQLPGGRADERDRARFAKATLWPARICVAANASKFPVCSPWCLPSDLGRLLIKQLAIGN